MQSYVIINGIINSDFRYWIGRKSQILSVYFAVTLDNDIDIHCNAKGKIAEYISKNIIKGDCVSALGRFVQTRYAIEIELFSISKTGSDGVSVYDNILPLVEEEIDEIES